MEWHQFVDTGEDTLRLLCLILATLFFVENEWII